MNETVSAVSGGVAGALATYLLMRGGEISTKIYERQKTNFNALIRLEYLCCQNMNNIRENVYVIDDFIGATEEPLKRNEPIVYGNKLFSIPFDDSLVLDLVSTDLMNEVLEYKVDITKTNHDIQSINEMYETFKNALIRKDVNFQTYRINTLMAIEKCKHLKIFLQSVETKTVRLGAREDKPFLTRIIHLFLRKKIFTEEFNKRLKEEIVKVENSRKEVAAKSESELREIKERISKISK